MTRTSQSLARARALAVPFLSAIIVAVFGGIAYLEVQREMKTADLVDHTLRVIDTNRDLLAQLVDAETGERGFIITGDSAYLEPYGGAAAVARQRIRELRQLTSDNPLQQARLDSLQPVIEHALSAWDRHITIRRQAGFDSARASIVRVGGGKATMDSVRAMVASVEREERRLLGSRNAERARYVRLVAWIIVTGTVLAAAVALLIDILLSRSAATQARLARQLEHRTLEAEEANRIKSRFLAGVSHDFRTPLNAIIGYADLLELGARGQVNDEQIGDLRRIKRNSNHLLSLVANVLEFAKIEASRIEVRLDELRVADVMASIDPLVRPQMQAKKLVFAQDECDPKLVVRADREKLDRILLNLLGNAITYTAPGGRIRVSCAEENGSVRLDVRDSGRGIPSDKLEAIFHPFVQVGRDSSSQGFGLGLSISRELARAMNGDITVTSTLGDGSTFTVRLPRVAVE